MLERFKAFIIENSLWQEGEKLLITVSGGVDSVVLAMLLKQCHAHFGIAHCNFQLRGSESERDAQFVEALAATLAVPFHVKRFDTHRYVAENKGSVQMVARTLRYAWFDELREEFRYDQVLTAHHANDSLETVLLNLTRGTGIAGLHGLKPKQRHVTRPLLFATKEEIKTYALEKKYLFREDSSNSSDKYYRNLIRNQVVPLLEKLNPNLVHTFRASTERISAAEAVLQDQVKLFREVACTWKNDALFVNLEKLKSLAGSKYLLSECLAEFGFTWDIVSKIDKALGEQSGKTFFSDTHQVLKDRAQLIVTQLKDKEEKNILMYQGDKTASISDLLIHQSMLDEVPEKIEAASSVAYLDVEKINYPLLIRRWQHGDRFYPLGMQGSKKVSDYLIDKKISLIEKEDIYVLLSEDNVAWVVNHRLDERFKITPQTKKVLKLETKFIPRESHSAKNVL